MNALVTAMTEAQLQATLVEAFETFGWLVFHDNDSRRNRAGFPDLVTVHPDTGWLAFLELKTEKGRLRPAQRTWLAALQHAMGHNGRLWADVVRPSGLDRALGYIASLATDD